MSVKFVLCLLLALWCGLAVAKDEPETVVYKIENDSVEDQDVYAAPEYYNEPSNTEEEGSSVSQANDAEDFVGSKREGAETPYPYYAYPYYPMMGVKSSVAVRADTPVDPNNPVPETPAVPAPVVPAPVVPAPVVAAPVNPSDVVVPPGTVPTTPLLPPIGRWPGWPGWPYYGWPYYGWPGHGYPGHGYPGHGWPGHGYPGHGYPGHGHPGHGWPGHGWPGYGHGPYPPHHHHPSRPPPTYRPTPPTHRPRPPTHRPRPDTDRRKICKTIKPFGRVCTYTDFDRDD